MGCTAMIRTCAMKSMVMRTADVPIVMFHLTARRGSRRLGMRSHFRARLEETAVRSDRCTGCTVWKVCFETGYALGLCDQSCSTTSRSAVATCGSNCLTGRKALEATQDVVAAGRGNRLATGSGAVICRHLDARCDLRLRCQASPTRQCCLRRGTARAETGQRIPDAGRWARLARRDRASRTATPTCDPAPADARRRHPNTWRRSQLGCCRDSS